MSAISARQVFDARAALADARGWNREECDLAGEPVEQWRGITAEYLKGGQPAGTVTIGRPNHMTLGERDRRAVSISWRGGYLVRVEVDRDAQIDW